MRLVLAMIVKNEKNTIKKTLDSCMDIIDKAYICDTGSTDDTKEIIKKTMTKDLDLTEDTFIDFSTNRNKVFAKIKEHEPEDTIILLLDANDVVVNGNDLLTFIKKNPDYDIYNTSQEWDDVGKKYRFVTTRVVKNNDKFHYENRIHEVLYPKDKTAKINMSHLIPNFYIYQNRDEDIDSLGEHTTMPRLERDYKILIEGYNSNPKDTRNLYYLNQTLYFMSRFEECKKYCEERFRDGTEDEETYQSMLRYAKCMFLLKEPWDDIEKALLKSYNFLEELQKKITNISILDIEPLTIIAFEYFAQKKYEKAHDLAKKICSIPPPQTMLPKDMSIYDYKRWQLLACTCEIFNDNSLGYEACNQALSSDQVSKVSQCYKSNKPKQHEKELIFTVTKLNELRQKFETALNLQYHRISNSPHVVIFGGSSYTKWNATNIKTGKGLGGAETSAVHIAENLSRNYGYKVVVFSDTDERLTVNGVEYMKLTDYQGYVTTHHIDTLIVLRYADAIKYGFNIKSVYLWLQDVDWIGKGFSYNQSLKGIITLCETHANYIRNKLPDEVKPIVKVIGNAINYDRFNGLDVTKKQQNRFIYSSCPTRGLEYLLEIFPDIKKIMIDAELHVFSDFSNEYAQKFPNIQEIGKKLQNGEFKDVIYHGRVDQDRLATEIMKSEFWLYPTVFPETYCITALEMMAGGVIPICSNLWALSETVTEKRGFMLTKFEHLLPTIKDSVRIPATAESKNIFKEEILYKIIMLSEKTNPETKKLVEDKRSAGIEFAKKQVWENMAKHWNTLIR